MNKYEQEVLLKEAKYLYFSTDDSGKNPHTTNLQGGGYIYFNKEDIDNIEVIFKVYRTRQYTTERFYTVHLEVYKDFRNKKPQDETYSKDYKLDPMDMPMFSRLLQDEGIRLEVNKNGIKVKANQEGISVADRLFKEMTEKNSSSKNDLGKQGRFNSKIKESKDILF